MKIPFVIINLVFSRFKRKRSSVYTYQHGKSKKGISKTSTITQSLTVPRFVCTSAYSSHAVLLPRPLRDPTSRSPRVRDGCRVDGLTRPPPYSKVYLPSCKGFVVTDVRTERTTATRVDQSNQTGKWGRSSARDSSTRVHRRACAGLSCRGCLGPGPSRR